MSQQRTEQSAQPEWSALAFTGVRVERPKVVVKADLLPAISVVSFVALVGIPLGLLWSWLAPPQRMRIVGGQTGELPLQMESWHRFDALAVFMLLGLAAGIGVGIVVWLMRERRGPVVLIAAVLGSALSAWLAMQMGLSFAGSSYAITDAPSVGEVVEAAPVLETGWVILAQPFTTALTYGMLAIWNSRDDLGRRLG
ncbi:hypothetical protein BJF85_01655 [Saccharomonospora sp. CUA-673]|uniref:DUF2567 domain-containing protein n=1 Tax=Saccharomonospora sp. CUA-673 TaxID=1904969 RepID=UPI00096421DA|nr:hypothetical protein BJF85_01655 [Saccharomonospora sp. CUA-673]